MIVVRITGGLGNQMFQYAFARALQSRGKNVIVQWHGHRTKSRHNGWELDTVFKNPLSDKIKMANRSSILNAAAWFMRKTDRRREPKNIGFSPECLDATCGYLDGYWQTEKYFADIDHTIREDFQFKSLEGEKNIQLQERIASEPCVSVHVRRGDYLNHSDLSGVCGTDYYNKAFLRLDEEHPGCTPIVFSDDIPFCRELFGARKPVFVGWNQHENSWMDMALMGLCKHHIIANSSFSWWGAWLAPSQKGVVVAPSRWYADAGETANPHICPDNWIKL
ncbi:MAG: alpha-1,2-fucosyltransferase [Kiritimatiellales bacterium]|nr:alpha-1,2-fucosyltransferase [Kiritimatiellales bacterium]MCF7863322.1 alpha-1,2-fucosyltransferase [Kiritimatiellales bacterium]